MGIAYRAVRLARQARFSGRARRTRPMAKRRRLAKRYRRNPDTTSITASAMPMGELWGWFGPGFAAFAAARFVTYLATQQLAKRKPSWGTHGGAVAAVGTFLAAWMAAHRVKWLKGYSEAIVIGTGIAAAQSVVQLYLPKLGWMIGDPGAGVAALPDPGQVTQLPPGFSVVDDPGAFEYNDAHDSGIFAQQHAPGQGAQQQAAPSSQDEESALFADLELDDNGTQGGIFAS